MQATPIKTHKISTKDSLFTILNTYLCHPGNPPTGGASRISPERDSGQARMTVLQEGSILAVSSKIVAITEGRVVPVGSTDKDNLIQQESQYYLPREANKYDVSFTITNNMLVPTAGIDESNADNQYVLWPQDPQKSANDIREHLVKISGLEDIGVIITDSRTVPLRWGVTAMAIAHSGFAALKDYIGTPDIFGRPFAFEKLNIADSLAAAAGVVMGEGNEQTPLAVLTDLAQVTFQQRNPTQEELNDLKITPEDDLYAPFLTSVKWEKGSAK